MNYELVGEITDTYFSEENEYHANFFLETELRFKFILFYKLSNLKVSLEMFKENVKNFQNDELYKYYETLNGLEFLSYFVDEFKYEDRKIDGGCKISFTIKLKYYDLILVMLSNVLVSDDEIQKFQIVNNTY